MKRKHFVLGFVFNREKDQVLLVQKKRPQWQAGRWNGIGGKIKEGETPFQAMGREALEETGCHYPFEHAITFVCPGGTVFVFKAICPEPSVLYNQIEDENLLPWAVRSLPNIMANLKWIIPVCLSSIQFPLIVQQNTLGVD